MASRKRRLREAMAFRMLLVAYHASRASMQRSEPKPDSYEDYTDEYTELCNLYEDWTDASTYQVWDWEDLEYWHIKELDEMARSLMGRLYPEFDADDWEDHMDGHREAYEQMIKWESVYPDDVCCDYYYEDCARAEEEDWNSWWFK